MPRYWTILDTEGELYPHLYHTREHAVERQRSCQSRTLRDGRVVEVQLVVSETSERLTEQLSAG